MTQTCNEACMFMVNSYQGSIDKKLTGSCGVWPWGQFAWLVGMKIATVTGRANGKTGTNVALGAIGFSFQKNFKILLNFLMATCILLNHNQ